MATVVYTDEGPCAGGGHRTIGVSFNGGASQSIVYVTEDLRAPLSALTSDERAFIALALAKMHFAGRTRAQIVTEFQAGPVTVTI